MRGRTRILILLGLIVLVPAAVAAGWWYYWPHYMLARAESAVAREDFARAGELLDQLIRTEPKNLRAHLLRVQVLRRLKKPTEAQAALLKAMKLGLSESDGRREFALAEVQKEFSPNAEKNLLQVLEERPDDIEVLQALAEGYAQAERREEAERCYTRLLELAPDRLDFHLQRGQVRLADVQRYRGRPEAAAADFRAVLERDPNHYEAHLYLSHSMLADARMDEAKKELLICQQLQPQRIEPLIGLAACAVEERDYDHAKQLLHQALEIEPGSAYAYGMLGDLEFRRQRFDQAIPFFERVLDLDPRNKAAHLKLAQALRYVGKPEQAKEHERTYQGLTEGKDQEP